MRPKISERVVTLFIAVGASILVPTVLLGEYSLGAANVYKDWPTFVFNFQTLIAGFLAIIAGYMTVKQMRISDHKSDMRHEQLIRLQKRGEGLVLDRAFTLVLPALRSIHAALKATPPLEIHNKETFFEDLDNYRDSARSVDREANRILTSFNHEEWEVAHAQFDGALLASVDRVKNAAVYLRSLASHAATFRPPAEDDYIIPGREARVEETRRQIRAAIEQISVTVDECAEQLRDLIGRMEKLAALYEIVI